MRHDYDMSRGKREGHLTCIRVTVKPRIPISNNDEPAIINANAPKIVLFSLYAPVASVRINEPKL